jgi:hypothetical protein
VFLDNPQHVEVKIRIEPPPTASNSASTASEQFPFPPREGREISPVFYLEPEDWSVVEDATPSTAARWADYYENFLKNCLNQKKLN